jgi:hypothetical protein
MLGMHDAAVADYCRNGVLEDQLLLAVVLQKN